MEHAAASVLLGVIIPVVLSQPFAGNWPYLDPGAGSLLIQLLVAGLVGLLYILKTQWTRIRRFARRVLLKKTGHERDDG